MENLFIPFLEKKQQLADEKEEAFQKMNHLFSNDD